MKVEDLKKEYDKLQVKYGAKELDSIYKEIDIIKPKVIITFGNQVSSIILNKKISVSVNRKI